jgi:hypothetical protein
MQRGSNYDAQRGANYDAQRAAIYDAQRSGYDAQRGPGYDPQSRIASYDAQSRGAAGPHGHAAPANNAPYGSATPPSRGATAYEAPARGGNPVRRWVWGIAQMLMALFLVGHCIWFSVYSIPDSSIINLRNLCFFISPIHFLKYSHYFGAVLLAVALCNSWAEDTVLATRHTIVWDRNSHLKKKKKRKNKIGKKKQQSKQDLFKSFGFHLEPDLRNLSMNINCCRHILI